MQRLSTPKGTRDFDPLTTRKRDYIIEKIERVFHRYAFQKIETSALENLSVLTGKYGEEGDQLLFKILNSGDFLKNVDGSCLDSKKILPQIAGKGLRYDLTVPFARYVVMNRSRITFPFKRYQIQPVWRADKPQKGRYREFYQCDADVIGTSPGWSEVELSLLISQVFQSLSLQDYRLEVNHRAILFELASWLGLKDKEIPFCTIIDKLDKTDTQHVLRQLRALSPEGEKLNRLSRWMNDTPNHLEMLRNLKQLLNDNAGVAFIGNYLESLSKLESLPSNIQFNWTLARGLSYYTGMIYEAKPTSVNMGSIAGGGRYDDLTGTFGLKDVSGVGVSFGIDRIFDVLEKLKLFPETFSQTPTLLITHADEAGFNHGQALLMKLRSGGLAADIYPERTKIKKQLSFANKTNVPFVITIGSQEIENELYPLKNMKTGEVREVKSDQLPGLLNSENEHF